jgi:hypothetical protein
MAEKEKFDFPKIFSEQFKFNMGPWLTEKSEFSLQSLLELRKDLIKIEDKIDKETLEFIQSDLSGAIYDITKIYSFSLGTNFDASDGALIYDKLDEGFEELKVKYGLLEKTSKQLLKEKYAAFFNKLHEYLEMEQFPGRSSLQELFENNSQLFSEQSINGRLLAKIEQDLFRMANGEITWNNFVSETKDLQKYFIKLNSGYIDDIKEWGIPSFLKNKKRKP